jgi:hypothetical protein
VVASIAKRGRDGRLQVDGHTDIRIISTGSLIFANRSDD